MNGVMHAQCSKNGGKCAVTNLCAWARLPPSQNLHLKKYKFLSAYCGRGLQKQDAHSGLIPKKWWRKGVKLIWYVSLIFDNMHNFYLNLSTCYSNFTFFFHYIFGNLVLSRRPAVVAHIALEFLIVLSWPLGDALFEIFFNKTFISALYSMRTVWVPKIPLFGILVYCGSWFQWKGERGMDSMFCK